MEKNEEIFLAFKNWLDKKKINVWNFSKLCKVSQSTLYKAYRGEKVRQHVAKALVKRSKNELSYSDFGYPDPKKPGNG